MIDSTKNLCYIITVEYLINNGAGKVKSKQCTFISLHSIDTKKCQEFALAKAKEDKQFRNLNDEGWLWQQTIPLSDYCK